MTHTERIFPQSSGPASPSALVSAETAPSSKNHTPKIFAYKVTTTSRKPSAGRADFHLPRLSSAPPPSLFFFNLLLKG